MDDLFSLAKDLTQDWRHSWGKFEIDDSLKVENNKVQYVFKDLQERLKNNYPFHHPVYVGQMLKPPHEIAMMAYLATMSLNPNNHALDGGPATAELEKETINILAKMFGFEKNLGHLTSSGTIANLEALWISRELHPDKSIAFSEQSHYTHKRMCQVIGVKSVSISSNHLGQMDINDLESKLKTNEIGTVVVTVGTTGLGALDPLDEILKLKEKYDFRIHVDSAYGGFYTVLKNTNLINGEIFKSISKVDSVVIDPHKHGLQPYGCGCIIFSNPDVGKLYSHDSPYTYFTSNELHLGEISLECSRSGSAAAAFWATLQLFPLEENQGFGEILKKTRESALKFYEHISISKYYTPLLKPELDIVCYLPNVENMKASEISKLTEKIFDYLEKNEKEPLFLAKFKVTKTIADKYISEWDQDTVTVLRSCFMKPEHLSFVDTILARLYKAYENCI